MPIHRRLHLLLFLVLAVACADEPPTPSAGNNSNNGNANNNADDAGLDDAGLDDADDTADDTALDVADDTAPDVADDADATDDVPPTDDVSPDVPEPVMCALATPAPADGDRVVLISHGNGAAVATEGTELRTMTLTTAGELLDDGIRFDVGFKIARMAFVPAGNLALVLGERGMLVSVRVGDVHDLEVLDVVELPSAGFGDIVLKEDGRTAYILGSNSTATGGLSTVLLGCDGDEFGQLTLVPEAFAPVLLANSLALLPGGQRGLVFGGQALFDPINDPRDVRLVSVDDVGFTEVGAFDIFTDYVSSGRIAVSPDGQLGLLPNDLVFSNEGGQLAVVAIDAENDEVHELQRLTDLPDVTEALFSVDGQTALVTLIEPGRVRVLTREADGMHLLDTELRAGLAEQMAMVPRGSIQGLVLVPAIDPRDGSNVTILRIEGKGIVTAVGRVLLGEGYDNIPDAVAVQP